VVILSKNEQANIARCIESVLSCIKERDDAEVLLVDSCSSDRTIDIANKYPINIIGLKKEWPHSPAAGRFTGVNNTEGKYILIIDGDMKLRNNWVEKALDFLERNPSVAAVAGRQYDIYFGRSGRDNEEVLYRPYADNDNMHEVDYVFRSSIFRRSALEKVGNFQPFLRAEEEAEISHRLRLAGFSLYFLPYDSVVHYTNFPNTLNETIRRTKLHLNAGLADMVAWALHKKYYQLIWGRYKVVILFTIMTFFTLIGLSFSLLLKNAIAMLVFAIIPAIFVAFMSFRKKSISQGIVGTIDKLILSTYMICGIFKKTREIKDYPRDVIWIKKAGGRD